MKTSIILLVLFILTSAACGNSGSSTDKLPVSEPAQAKEVYKPFTTIVTTDYINELIYQFARNRTTGRAIIPRGSDPFSYMPSEQDKQDILKADVVFYNGLGLEPHLEKILIEAASKTRVVDLSKAVPREKLIASKQYPSGYDPHYFKDPDIWVHVAKKVVDVLSEIDPQGQFNYGSIYMRYGEALSLHDLRYVMPWSNRLPDSRRYLITLHDCFQYFAKRYHYNARSLLAPGDAKVDKQRLDQLAAFIIEKKVPVIFYEESYEQGPMEELQEKVQGLGGRVKLAGPLYSYFKAPMGDPLFYYVTSGRHDIQLIYENLKTEDMPDIPK